MGKKIHEVTRVDELQLSWRSTDSLRKLLQRYLQEDAKESKGGPQKATEFIFIFKYYQSCCH